MVLGPVEGQAVNKYENVGHALLDRKKRVCELLCHHGPYAGVRNELLRLMDEVFCSETPTFIREWQRQSGRSKPHSISPFVQARVGQVYEERA